ncbi:MAG TPA: adenylate/guanylate cyclase domain-containing protein [Bradyrhizobium sp.]|nr:adenylate/guanylate cyclase domain-containing protein [Bradyrhizobium sp.]
MPAINLAEIEKFIRGISARQLRLVCGLVLFAYLISHFLNHALGNISLEALAWGLHYHLLFWQFLPVAIVFYTALLVHGSLGIWALYERRQFRWKAVEPLQLVLGLSIPMLAAAHVIATRLGHTLFGFDKFYPQVLHAYWATASNRIWLTLSVLIIAWIHGSIGLYFWLRMKTFFRRAAPFLLAAAVLVPTLALLGLYQSGRMVVEESTDPEWRAANLAPEKVGTPAQADRLERITGRFAIGYLGLLGLVLVARGVRTLRERRVGMITLSYGNGRTVRVPKGLSVLEASLRHQVPHASVCGGRARCSTCRIRVIGDCTSLPEPSNREAFVLNRVGSGSDPAIRLACQLRPQADLSFFQIFTPQTVATRHGAPSHIGEERYLVSMFVDMRGSTRLAENRLPFDTVFVVNRFLGAVSQAVIECGGQPNQFLGDGQLALFGLATSRQAACRQALKAAGRISVYVEELNQFLKNDLREPIRFGIGIDGGEVIVGDIGYRDHMVFTALGDAVNVAARLQDMTKSLGCEAVVSDEVRATAGLAPDALPQKDVEIRGRAEPMSVRVVASAGALTALALDEAPVAA